ncbi:probable Putative unspecific racemase [Rhynchosporium graminicola]|uniref:Pyridoxal phosphate homeostasis protein n=1 Tax=Rhynchosporium graminicola TaxID=2792576 RepID=A0A1E1KQ49_9HELO|nr:probable Putative unspecific racemase [Rhynchosporium commune]
MSDQASTETNMKIDPTRAKGLIEALQSVQSRVTKASTGRNVRLVAVSKLKPASDILALYQEGHRNFGENYAQELMEKAQVLPKDIKWHFIGGLQSNKCKPLASTVSNLYLVSSIDSAKKATQLNLGRETLDPQPPTPLNIHIQVNTSNEASKSGVSPGSETSALAKHILATCPHLHLLGLMTIGAIARSKATVEGKENEDFTTLREERDRLEKELVEQGLLSVGKGEGGEGGLECSMGMSEDFEEAIRAGSGEVRVGSTIFGTRPKREDFNIKGDVEEAKS